MPVCITYSFDDAYNPAIPIEQFQSHQRMVEYYTVNYAKIVLWKASVAQNYISSFFSSVSIVNTVIMEISDCRIVVFLYAKKEQNFTVDYNLRIPFITNVA
jgi:hypothetical protein